MPLTLKSTHLPNGPRQTEEEQILSRQHSRSKAF